METLEKNRIAFAGQSEGVSSEGQTDANAEDRSWMWAAKILGFEFAVACPENYAPTEEFLEKLDAPNVSVSHSPV